MSKSSKSMDVSEGGAELPGHIAIVMDGNGRWARRRALPRVAGHRKGVDIVRRTIEHCGRIGIRYLTVFAFSSENWNRPSQEVERLMELFVESLDKHIGELHENNIRFKVIGDIESLSETIQERIARSEALTRTNAGMTLMVALNYGGRWDIGQAAKNLAIAVQRGDIEATTVNEESIQDHLSTRGVPDPDLFIRTGGEKRISNFLLWQLAYTELYFTDLLWPEFDENELDRAVEFYSGRQRRFGMTGEQVEAD